MSDTQGQRIHANCEIIWGKGDYDIDVEHDDWEFYQAFVRRYYGTSLGFPLLMTSIHNSEDRVWRELDEMLDMAARKHKPDRK